MNEAFTSVKINAKSGRKAKHFKCAGCGKDFPQKDVQVDHIDPVVPIGWNGDWNVVIDNMYCEKENLQVLCTDCHKVKSDEERKQRKAK